MPSASPWKRVSTGLILTFMSAYAAATQRDMTPGVTAISEEVFELHRLMLYICTVIGAGVFGVMFYSIYKHRKSKGHQAAQFHESTAVEIAWTVVPFLILIFMAIPATQLLIEQDDTSESVLTVKITGSQWKWHYEYLEYEGNTDLNLGFFSSINTPQSEIRNPTLASGLFPNGSADDFSASYPEKSEFYKADVDNPLVIPTGQKVRFLVTSDDVIHSWWVPDFAVKRDAIPGFINHIWANVPVGKERVYRGQCTELCGALHAFMPVVVEAKNQNDFKLWLAQKQEEQKQAELLAASDVNKTFSMDELMAEGEQVYLSKCAACHQVAGTGLPPTFPALAGSTIATQTDKIPEHISIVLNGKGTMPGFGGALTPKETAAVVTYERNAWGNNTGELVQPADVVKLK